MTPELEKKIEETAKQLAGFSPLQEVDDEERYYQSHKCNTYDACIKMAKSDAAKDYWQKGMHTEEEVYNIAAQSHSHGYSLCLGSTNDILEFPEWFELNKKK